METKRLISKEAEELLGVKIPCLDKGFVQLVSYDGTDASIVEAARVSYGKEFTALDSAGKGLIHYLMRHEHSSPFEMVTLKFHMKLPIFVARQWVRHRTASLNEISARYSILPEDAYLPGLNDIEGANPVNKQGRGSALDVAVKQRFQTRLGELQDEIFSAYRAANDSGVAKELSRLPLSVSTYTEWFWKSDLRNILHLLKLRLDKHAQKEIRVYAEAMASCVKAVAPVAYEAFADVVLNGIRFSQSEIEYLRKLLPKEFDQNYKYFPTPNRNQEFISKLKSLIGDHE